MIVSFVMIIIIVMMMIWYDSESCNVFVHMELIMTV